MPKSQSPERRSAADLQRILDSMIGQSGFVLAGALPDVLSAYESENDSIISDPSEYQGLRASCTAHAEMELGPAESFQFLSMIQKPQDGRPPTPPNSSSTGVTSATHPNAQIHNQSTPHQVPRRKRHSDRIRSPSDSSSSSSEDDIGEAVRRRQERHSSEPANGKPFPAMPDENSSFGNRPLPPRRKKTLSDSSRNDSPLAMRVQRNGTAPPSAFGSFARPSPASRRRRGSSGAYASDQDESYREHSSGRFGRSVSQHSATSGMKSPTWSNRSDSVPPSPISPRVDQTSFHARARSPEDSGEEEARAAEDAVEDRGEESVHGGDRDSDESDDVVGQAMLGTEALNPRLSRISTESTTSSRTSHDKLQASQKQNSELTRKLKESERQSSLSGADNDRMVVDSERQLEEARHELAQKRKEDKELRGHELKQNIQISGLEADLANVQRTLEQSKEHRANMQKMYDSQCDEAQRSRDSLRDRDEEIHNLEESLQEHEADEGKYTREIESLGAEIKRLESESVVARRAESVSETQKQENSQLKETIDRMRFDLDEARAAAAAKASHGRSSTNASSAGGTSSRNLGDEINRRSVDAEVIEEQDIQEEAEHDEDGIVETIVTKQRIRRIGGRKIATSNGEQNGVPDLRIEEFTAEYADVGTLTDPVEVLPPAGPSSSSSPEGAQDTPPAYTAQPDPINEQEVLDRAHPRKASFNVDVVDEYDVVVRATGVRCSVSEDAIAQKKAEKAKNGSSRRSSFFSRPERTNAGVLGTIVHVTSDASAGKISAYIVGAFAIGLVAGSHFWSGTAGVHPRDLQLWSSYNDLAASTGAGEGFLPAGALSLAGLVGAGAHGVGWVPT